MTRLERRDVLAHEDITPVVALSDVHF